MDDLLLQQNLAVGTDLDRVVLIVNRTHYPMPYAASFKISAGLRLASKMAMKFSGEGITDWRAHSILDEYPKVGKISAQRRATLINQFSWNVKADSEIVILTLGDQEIRLHFTAAIKIAEWLRMSGRNAKRWAGDRGRTITSMGNLNDAEWNYKHGF